jgi:CubicO group peptidase (beta-lactamase class C family)
VRIGLLAAALLCVLTSVPAQAAALRTLDGRRLTPAAIDRRVEGLMRANRVHGLAVALIRDGRVAYVHAYGVRDEARGLPLTTGTVMYGASLTKATFAYMVMQLVDEGRVDLDHPIAAYLPKPLPDYPQYADLAGDARWRKLTLRILLDHTSGFANFRWIDPDEKLRFHNDPGARFGYSGEGINLAQFVLEKGLGLDVGAEMQRRVFDRFGMTRTSLLWRDDFAADLAQGYTIDGKLQEHDRRSHLRAAGSMDTTVSDWSAFLAGVARGDGLSARAKAEMIRLQIPIDSVAQFPTLAPETTDGWRPIRLGYGVGWGVFETPFGHAYFKEGHDDAVANYALCVEPKRACVLLMSNDVRAEGIFLALVGELMGQTNLPWRWMGYIPYDLTADRMKPVRPAG